MLRKFTYCGALLALVGGNLNLEAAPFGAWKSPITSQSLVEGAIQLKQLEVDGDELYWLEGRPEEQGRSVFVRASDKKELFSKPYYARTTVYEYGGKCGAFYKGTLYFTNFEDQYLYRVKEGEQPEAVVKKDGLRFSDFVISQDGSALYSILEDHNGEGECKNSIVRVDLETFEITPVAEGYDFYAFPRVSPDGTKVAYIAWNHPNMMWDETELFITDLTSGKETKIAGGKDESVSEPRWTPCNRVVYVSDRDGYWKLYTQSGNCIIDKDCDFTFPLWWTGVSRTAFVETKDGSVTLTVATDKGSDHFICIHKESGETTTFPKHEFTFINELHTMGDKVVFIASGPKAGSAIYKMDPLTGEYEVLKKSKDKSEFGEEYISVPETLEFPTENGKTAFGFYYPPHNPDVNIEEVDGLPPLIVFTHGGPTGHQPPQLNAKIQFFTSRGFGVVDVNYGGSTGYGREYRNRLRRNWGTVDVDDCCNAALYLAKSGRVDGEKLAIEGGSAGGYTTLAALTFRDVFAAGASYFGVSDIALMLSDTHKYEARYFDSLVGKYPEEKELYDKHSPLNHADNLSCPVLLLQGAEDKIVPPNQAEKMYDVLLEKKIPTAYILYEKEQHGFRIAENITHSLESELYFYQRIFGIPVETENAPIKIVNLDE